MASATEDFGAGLGSRRSAATEAGVPAVDNEFGRAARVVDDCLGVKDVEVGD